MDDSGLLAVEAVSLAVVVVAFAAFGFLLFRAGRLPHPAPIVISLSMLTGAALLLGAQGSETMLTLAATGFGALAGALSAIYRPKDDDDAAKGDDDEPAA
jgi:hypothetical protein